MAHEKQTHELCVSATLECPDFFDVQSSNFCVQVISTTEVLVGNENGCYISNINVLTKERTRELIQFRKKEIPSVCCCDDDPNLFFVSCDRSIYSFDKRVSLESSVNMFSENSDDINQIKFQTGLLTSCDDAGEIKMFDLKTNQLFRTLRNKHTNICSSICYFPNRPNEIVTGGLDSQLFIWDYRRVKILQAVNTQTILEGMGDNSVYMFNPPFVHSMDINENGNGTLQVFNILKGKRVIAPSILINHHSTLGVSWVHYLSRADQASTSILASGGNDGIVNLWSFPQEMPKKQTLPVNRVLTEQEIASHLITQYNANSKINFLNSAILNDKMFLFVADQTSAIKLLELKE
ncbi:WD repeat-containing protein 53 homolog isoform X2 [Hydractinia symbiolongicarpus]|uniref:WD repeat-containing protein 53 homolog isoform X2 n=1 Tax=Hydractinia symbiolongicarpus TaxID=13093 RepID=UPI0025519E71|nr:WD repeat-containing protein 53 homolog isoform X2 [Hydractinia symbiolongicarpus]